MAPQQTMRSPSARTDATATPQDDSMTDRLALNSEDLHVRSYEHQMAHDLDVGVYAPDGETVFEAQYRLEAGAVKSEINTLPPGVYEIRASLDDARETRRRCRIGDAPDRTAVIEVGNGVVSVTERFPR
ncbi:MAG: hypothetical protein ABEI27_13235 [Halobellus sp.]|uniref:hypothetical protein n=1 Tax=Halobellus sp. TaxID=1979212 RepID=UPI0035D4E426